ncbi:MULTISPECIES: hypothetical protein [Shewanella]|uniref:hypothetical protein n=1 Tax=Shewanella TaxID=22 RepID=UPI0006D66ACE|nr:MULTISPECIES: hypothetical protein [Shewanella]KPZ72876.1 hypothetical protein AN944_00565 [Shewanella sp. P1-14-1]MBQ4888456.1 hypothetical protein [Shewanella sp. MMG014]
MIKVRTIKVKVAKAIKTSFPDLRLLIGTFLVSGFLIGCGEEQDVAAKAQVSVEMQEQCGEQEFLVIAEKVSAGDGQGHGPDIGSDEWQSVIEFKLGIRGQADVPARDDVQWCQFILKKL